MDKNAIKKYAVWARRELIDRVTKRAAIYGITDKNTGDYNVDSVNGHLLSGTEKRQRQALIHRIEEKSYEQVMEEVAYTWFNRFAALRFMEVNGYLPSHIRVFTDDEGRFKPQILSEAIHLELDGLNMEKVYQLKDANQEEELFKYLLIVQCNALNSILPGMFQKLEDYTELLLPDYLLREGSVIEQMITLISEDDWKDQVQIIGWLYQYYIAEPKDELINARKQYKDEDIPFVTQLFTSDWIVRFMVENSLGRFWLDEHPNPELKAEWKYFLDDSELNSSAKQITHSGIKPEEILTIDPCQGSGHILAYIFDTLILIYQAYGYSAREAATSIVEHNIWGLDIDERASQLAYFSVMMKARQYDRRFFSHTIQPHVYSINESNNLDTHCIEYFVDGRAELKTAMDILVKELHDAKEYGSSLEVTEVDFDTLFGRFDEIRKETEPSIYSLQVLEELEPFVQVAKAMSQKYHAVITNPPYLSASYMPNKLKDFVQEMYPDFKNDMFSVFMKRSISMCVPNGHIGLLLPYVWMFIVTYDNMRIWLNRNADITALVQLEYNAFEAACVPVASLTMRKGATGKCGQYIRLSDFKGIENQNPKTLYAVSHPNCGYRYQATQQDFIKIPGEPIAYWLSQKMYQSFAHLESVSSVAEPRQGMATADNNRFLRLWHEVSFEKIGFNMNSAESAKASHKKWFPYCKGGAFRKWAGNNDYLVNWENDGFELKSFKGSVIRNPSYYFKTGMSWSSLTIGAISFRYTPVGFLFDSKGPVCFAKETKYEKYLIGFLNSKVAMAYLNVLAPTMDYSQGPISKIPYIYDPEKAPAIELLVNQCIGLTTEDWNQFETSWGFTSHPLVRKCSLISDAYEMWKEESIDRFTKLKECEEEINQLFIDIYGFSNEISPEVSDEYISIRKADLKREVISLISYAVGCMFGRYSLSFPGIAYAGGAWDESKYKEYKPDTDAIIPICDDEYFDDDIVNRFIKFIETVYGQESLDANLDFIASVLGGKGNAKEVIREYFINDFFTDHCSTYSVTGSGKRPIYWLFDSGKKNGFKCLIYIHRYKPDILARIRTDYVHEQQSRYRTAMNDLEQRISRASTSERVKLNKRLSSLKMQSDEIRMYEEKIHHLADQMIQLDLDDGFKNNYSIFKDVVAKVK